MPESSSLGTQGSEKGVVSTVPDVPKYLRKKTLNLSQSQQASDMLSLVQ